MAIAGPGGCVGGAGLSWIQWRRLNLLNILTPASIAGPFWLTFKLLFILVGMKMTKALRYAFFFGSIGLAITSLVVVVQQKILNTYQQNLPYISLGDNLKNRSTRAHLWFEEAIAGDQSISYRKDVLPLFVSCQHILQNAYDGKQTELGKFDGQADEETRVIIKEALINIENLIAAANNRWEHNSNSVGQEAGSQLDQDFDSSYESFQNKLEQLIVHVSALIRQDESNLKSLSWVTNVSVFLTFSVLCVLLYRLQRGTDQLIAQSQQKLDQEFSRVSTMKEFIEAVSTGNFNIELNAATADDGLTNTLIGMRDKLKENAENDHKRNWATGGLAQIGEILRASSTSSTELFDNIIRFVVKYTKSNQGGMFILNDEEQNQHLDLVACYAFERKKFLTKKVDVGQGLVGQCYLEGERIYLLEVPEDYVTVTSGLGGATPNALLIVPMKVNDKVYGVIELASFTKYEDHEIELVEKLAESIASTISNVRVNETTRILLEKTQQQAEEMKSQEEEIRQNMEELEATQEEMRRKQTILEKELQQSQLQSEVLRKQEKKLTESQDTLQAIVDNIPRAIFWKDKELRFMGCNRIFANVAGAESPQDLIGKSDFDMAWSAQADAYRKDDLEVMKKRQAKLDIEEVNVNSEGEESWVLTSKVPIINQQNEVVAILGMFEDITARKRKEADVAKKLEEREAVLKELNALKQLIQTGKV